MITVGSTTWEAWPQADLIKIRKHCQGRLAAGPGIKPVKTNPLSTCRGAEVNAEISSTEVEAFAERIAPTLPRAELNRLPRPDLKLLLQAPNTIKKA